jgi:hypothetical protein
MIEIGVKQVINLIVKGGHVFYSPSCPGMIMICLPGSPLFGPYL